MTYLPKVYEPSPANWTADVGVDTDNAGNVIIVPDWIYDTTGHEAVYEIVTFQGSDGGLWIADTNKMVSPVGASPSDYFVNHQLVTFYYSEQAEIVVGTPYYIHFPTGIYDNIIKLSLSLYGAVFQETGTGGSADMYNYTSSAYLNFINDDGEAWYREWRIKCVGDLDGHTVDYYYPEGSMVSPITIFSPNTMTDLVSDASYYVLPYDAQDLIDDTMQVSSSLEPDYQPLFGYNKKESKISVLVDPEFPGNEIPNNIGVAAVGTTDVGASTDWNCYYPRLTRTFPLVGATPSGTVIVQDGWKVDFAQDLSQPSVVATFGVNKDVFNFNDNDDARKLCTRAVVRGKDINGISISVSLLGIRAYDTERQFYNNCTYISRKSEGYIYKNTYATDKSVACTFIPGTSVTYSVDYGVDHYGLVVGSGGFVVGNSVSFTNPPLELSDGTTYYIVDHTGTRIKVSSTLGGSPIHLNWKTNYLTYIYNTYTITNAGDIIVSIKGTVAKTVAVSYGDTPSQVAGKINTAFAGGYVDGDGNTWTCPDTYGNTVAFKHNDENLASSVVSFSGDAIGLPDYNGYTQSAWTVTLTASDLGIVQVNNLDGWFTESMQISFAAATMPTGISADAVYNVGGAPAISATATFPVIYEGSFVNFTTTGSGVVCFKPNTIHNLDEDGSPCIWLYGWGYAIKTSETIGVSVPGDAVIPLVVLGTPLEVVDINGVMCTTVPITTVPSIDYGGGKGFLMNSRFYVNDKSQVIGGESHYHLRFGEEEIAVVTASCGTDAVYGDYLVTNDLLLRVTSATKKCYPHGVGALVMNYDSPEYPFTYDLDNPEAGSPVALHGERVVDVTVDSNITYGYLDAYATGLLLGNGTLFKKATCRSPIHLCVVKRVGELQTDGVESIQELSRVTLPRVGDRIAIADSADATPIEWEVMSVTVRYDEGVVDLVLGDFEMNPITSMLKQTNAINRPLT